MGKYRQSTWRRQQRRLVPLSWLLRGIGSRDLAQIIPRTTSAKFAARPKVDDERASAETKAAAAGGSVISKTAVALQQCSQGACRTAHTADTGKHRSGGWSFCRGTLLCWATTSGYTQTVHMNIDSHEEHAAMR